MCTSQHIVDFFSRSLLLFYLLTYYQCICCGVGISKLEAVCFLPQKYDIQYMLVFTPSTRNKVDGEVRKITFPKIK